MQSSSTESFIGRVASHAGVSADRAELVTRAVLARIGGSLAHEQRQQIADELPPALGAAVLAPEALVDDALGIHERKLVASVYRVLASELSTDGLGSLRANLPARMSELLVTTPAPTGEIKIRR